MSLCVDLTIPFSLCLNQICCDRVIDVWDAMNLCNKAGKPLLFIS